MDTGSVVGRFHLPPGNTLSGLGRTLGRAGYLAGQYGAANHRADPHLDRLIGEAKH